MYEADLGMTLIYGIIVAIPAILVAGPLFSRTLKKYNPTPPKGLFEARVFTDEEMPSIGLSILTALLPVLLIGTDALAGLWLPDENLFKQVLGFIGDPVIAMLVSVLAALYLLGLRRGKKMSDLSNTLSESIKSITLVLLIIGGAGGLKQVLSDSGVSNYIAELLIGSSVSPLILAWGIASVIRICVGSATVAGLTTAGIILPLVASSGVKPELMVLATGAGSLMFSHVNDGGFWLFKEYFNMSITDTLKTWSVMETLVSVMGLLGVLVLNWVL